MSIPYSDIEYDANCLKVKFIDDKNEKQGIGKNVSVGYTKNRVPIVTQKYYRGYHIEKSIHDLNFKIRQYKNK